MQQSDQQDGQGNRVGINGSAFPRRVGTPAASSTNCLPPAAGYADEGRPREGGGHRTRANSGGGRPRRTATPLLTRTLVAALDGVAVLRRFPAGIADVDGTVRHIRPDAPVVDCDDERVRAHPCRRALSTARPRLAADATAAGVSRSELERLPLFEDFAERDPQPAPRGDLRRLLRRRERLEERNPR